jgi:hypothetical protein
MSFVDTLIVNLRNDWSGSMTLLDMKGIVTLTVELWATVYEELSAGQGIVKQRSFGRAGRMPARK